MGTEEVSRKGAKKKTPSESGAQQLLRASFAPLREIFLANLKARLQLISERCLTSAPSYHRS
jgi:hypothetical protein